MSADLSADGTTGVLAALSEQLYMFDVATGQLTDTGVTGAWPVRYSVDGKYIAFRGNNSGLISPLTVVAKDGMLSRQAVGPFSSLCSAPALATSSSSSSVSQLRLLSRAQSVRPRPHSPASTTSSSTYHSAHYSTLHPGTQEEVQFLYTHFLHGHTRLFLPDVMLVINEADIVPAVTML